MKIAFQRVLIVNRGEAAMRFIAAARELNREYNAGIRCIALYTDSDIKSMFVREADETFHLGPATFVDPKDGERKSTYLDLDRLREAILQTRAQAVWVGWGFVAEMAAFADLCADLGVVFIGPSGAVMRKLGDKISSKLVAEQVGVPVVAWSSGPVHTLDEALAHAQLLGFPLLIKATAGGGGRGIRRVRSELELAEALESARNEALHAFGNATVFMESMLTGARHIEVQAIADAHGNAWAVGVRDCTVQRRNQKVIEEAPSPALTPAQDREFREAAVRLIQAVGYTNAGTVEFLYESSTKRYAFMEVNARLQVEHPVTEATTGLDMVKLQIHVASGGTLEGSPPETQGHAIEVRLCAEDPERAFAPAPGTFERFRVPTGPGLRIDTGFDQGDTVAPEFDSMVAKLIAYGRNRAEALARLRRGLAESAITLQGGITNKGFLLQLLGRPEIISGEVDIGWLDRLVATGEHQCIQCAEVALLHTAIHTYEQEANLDKQRLFRSALRGRPEVESSPSRRIDLHYRGHDYTLEVRRLALRRFLVTVDGNELEVTLELLGRGETRLLIGSKRFRVLTSSQGTNHLVEVDGIPHRISSDRGGIIRSPLPAVVVSMNVSPGDEVVRGSRLCVLEAMKMEIELRAETKGRVHEVLVGTNIQVPPGTPLLIIEASDAHEETHGQTRIQFDELINTAPPSVAALWRTHLAELRSLVLGYDVDSRSLRRILTLHGSLSYDASPSDPRLWRHEHEILRIFVDVLTLFHRRPVGPEDIDDHRLSTGEYFLTYLRDLGAEGEGLPPKFIDKLRRALQHYGIENLKRSPELEEGLYRIFKTHLRREEQLPMIYGLLQRRLDNMAQLRPLADDTFAELLERLIADTHGELQRLNELAREVRFQYNERPLLETVRQQAYHQAEDHLRALTQPLEPIEIRKHISSLVACPQPLTSFLSRRLPDAPLAFQKVLLEVIVSRYYRIRKLGEFQTREENGILLGTVEYLYENKYIHVIAAHVMHDRCAQALHEAAQFAKTLPADHDVVIDIFTFQPMPLGDLDTKAAGLLEQIRKIPFERRMRRVVIAATGLDREAGPYARNIQHFTFRPVSSGENTGYSEEKHVRGLHPMMAKRLHFWRFSRFAIERLPSAEDLYFFRGVAHDNPKDERLFALAEVRDLTAIRDKSGRVIALPHIERLLIEALASIRRFQSSRAPKDRLHWNRVKLLVWPPLMLSPDELDDLIHRLAPATEGLGLERVMVRARMPNPRTGELEDKVIDIFNLGGKGVTLRFRDPPTEPIQPLSPYTQKVVRLRQMGMNYPYELLSQLASPTEGTHGDFPPGEFIEHELAEDGENLVPVKRNPGENKANIVVGLIKNFTSKVPEGMTRVILLGDPSKDMGALAEGECRRINAAIALAQKLDVPLEWFALSAGAKISMESGTENMDWIALVLRRLIEFTQAGGEVNIVVDGINVGAQPYWNAEATMLMHTRGILIMTAQGAMVLTGKRALDYSGGVSAEDNFGIGGYERIMGPNGQAQYYAEDIAGAVRILFRHYEHTYRVPGERFPRRGRTEDPIHRDISSFPHAKGMDFATVGEVLSNEKNAERKKPFDIRSILRSVVDQDHAPLERWYGQRGAEVSVVWDAHIGGYPVCLLGIESRPLPRLGFNAGDGPDQWTAGTLFPIASKKTARAINSASNNRPLVVLANLSGFDGSPESMRNLQLEYGAEIGRSVVNFKGPIIFCVISRYHGGAFVVFSAKLNDRMEIAALDGTYASVIGGAPAAAVVFTREVEKRTKRDARVAELESALARAEGPEKVRLEARYNEMYKLVNAEMLGAVADEFDSVHTIQRAQRVGSVHRIIAPTQLRSYLADAIERGIHRELESLPKIPALALEDALPPSRVD